MGDRGFTLVEMVILVVVLAIALPVMLMVFGRQASLGVDSELQISASQQAQALMEEIKSRCWDEYQTAVADCAGAGTGGIIGPDGTESRTACTGVSADAYDDVDDYDGYSETCTVGGIQYTRTVDVCYVDPADLDTCQAAASDYKRIRVSVSTADFGPLEAVTVATRR